MSQDNVEALKRILEAGSRGDFDTMTELLDPAFEWHSAIFGPVRGGSSVVRGQDRMPTMFRDFYDAFSDTTRLTQTWRDNSLAFGAGFSAEAVARTYDSLVAELHAPIATKLEQRG